MFQNKASMTYMHYYSNVRTRVARSYSYFAWMNAIMTLIMYKWCNYALHRLFHSLTHWSLVDFNITNESVPQQLARQAPAAQDAAVACLPGYYS